MSESQTVVGIVANANMLRSLTTCLSHLFGLRHRTMAKRLACHHYISSPSRADASTFCMWRHRTNVILKEKFCWLDERLWAAAGECVRLAERQGNKLLRHVWFLNLLSSKFHVLWQHETESGWFAVWRKNLFGKFHELAARTLHVMLVCRQNVAIINSHHVLSLTHFQQFFLFPVPAVCVPLSWRGANLPLHFTRSTVRTTIKT